MSVLRLQREFSRCRHRLLLIYGHWLKRPALLLRQRIGAFFKATPTIDDESVERLTVRRIQEPTFSPLQNAAEWNCAASRVTAEIQQSALPESPVLMGGSGSYRSADLAVDEVTTGSSAPAADSLLVLYVTAHQRDRIYGEPLLRSLLQLGFRHGEQAVFHRHLNPLGSGPILFSVVNMVKPGGFAPSSMSEFTTPGVALCMRIPAYGDTVQNFKLMVQAAQRLADDVGGVVLDDEHHLLTLQKSEQYKAWIRRLLAESP